MKTIVLGALALSLLAPAAFAKGSHAVKGYVKKNGTVVAPTRATNPNKTERDNFSSKGNLNPATGKEGTKTPKR